MIVAVRCAVCADAVVDTAEVSDLTLVGALLVADHCDGQHVDGHRLYVEIDSAPMPNGAHELTLACAQAGCTREPASRTVRTPLTLVAAHCLLFHSAHEGHQMRAVLDGVVFHEPHVPPAH